ERERERARRDHDDGPDGSGDHRRGVIDPVSAGGRDEHTLLAALLDEARSPVLALDADGRILYANAAASLVVRLERQDLIGKPFGSLLRAGERRAFRSALRSAEASPVTVEIAFANGPVTSMPVVVRHLPGTSFVAVSFD